MGRSTAARVAFGATAVTAAVGMALSLYVANTVESGQFTSAGARLLNQLCYFTIQSNILVAVVFGLLAVRAERRSLLFRALWLAALVDIVVTGVVYYLMLDQSHDTALGLVASTILHAVVPIASVLAAAFFGPRGMVSAKVAACAALVPLAWLALTLVRGAIIDWYPYPFIDVSEHGYGKVLLNLAVMSLFFVALYAIVAVASRSRRRGGGASALASDGRRGGGGPAR